MEAERRTGEEIGPCKGGKIFTPCVVTSLDSCPADERRVGEWKFTNESLSEGLLSVVEGS